MSTATRETSRLQHGRIALALHRYVRPPGNPRGRNLLMLHGLGESTPIALPGELEAWGGEVHGLDFTGHGESDVPVGGGYTAEILMADADAALADIGPATLYGRGLGAWVALLLAGARPGLVQGAILSDGPGLAGGGPEPTTVSVTFPAGDRSRTPDPFALMEFSRDLRPPDYALSYLRAANELSELDTPIVVSAVVRPTWLSALVDAPGVGSMSLVDALGYFGSST